MDPTANLRDRRGSWRQADAVLPNGAPPAHATIAAKIIVEKSQTLKLFAGG
jgi:hypothetical protein